MKFLKEGAAATYGSDAIAGVVNFITDSTFEGLRVNFAAKGIPNAEGDLGMNFLLLTELWLMMGQTFLFSLGHNLKPNIIQKYRLR